MVCPHMDHMEHMAATEYQKWFRLYLQSLAMDMLPRLMVNEQYFQERIIFNQFSNMKYLFSGVSSVVGHGYAPSLGMIRFILGFPSSQNLF